MQQEQYLNSRVYGNNDINKLLEKTKRTRVLSEYLQRIAKSGKSYERNFKK